MNIIKIIQSKLLLYWDVKYIVLIVHLLLVILSIISIIIPNNSIKKYALIYFIFILFHYITNNGRCGLTELEYMLFNKDYTEGFIYKIIKPLIKIPEIYFNYYLYIFHILWIFILYYQLIL